MTLSTIIFKLIFNKYELYIRSYAFDIPTMRHGCLEWEFTNLTEYASAVEYSFCPKCHLTSRISSLRTQAVPKRAYSLATSIFKGYFFSSKVSF